ncbi:hypothetical protein FE224_03890 [Serratia marcescens]|uniref:hypothetical protein n=1 Tax=Serratia marcescens TaxID=615 RepID=UPI0015948C13|nr:hypothetical protein [Serratia marcescens]NVC31016.1 hypothetical protein [Serratia marcescens]NVC46906.1 hypothetical protein [Serratia marcescens]QLB25389.1 hypothetical protein FEF07_08995 [Serratia marcescens]
MNKFYILMITLALGGCASTYPGKMDDKTRKDVTVNGYEIHVINPKGNSYEAFGGESIGYDAIKLKKAQVAAIEKVSGCKVTDAEYSSTFVRTLHAEVSCK